MSIIEDTQTALRAYDLEARALAGQLDVWRRLLASALGRLQAYGEMGKATAGHDALVADIEAALALPVPNEEVSA